MVNLNQRSSSSFFSVGFVYDAESCHDGRPMVISLIRQQHHESWVYRPGQTLPSPKKVGGSLWDSYWHYIRILTQKIEKLYLWITRKQKPQMVKMSKKPSFMGLFNSKIFSTHSHDPWEKQRKTCQNMPWTIPTSSADAHWPFSTT